MAFSRKKPGFCPSCSAKEMAEGAELLLENVLWGYPIRQCEPSLPLPLSLLITRYPEELSKVMEDNPPRYFHRYCASGRIS